MSNFSNLLRSLLIASIVSFAMPVTLIGMVLIGFSVIGVVPYFESIRQVGIEQVLEFLSIFGSGRPLQGVIVIGLACSLVGVLFDSFTLYRQQNLRNH
ncbi:MAG: hypothetical protein ACFE0I_14285 [Elainellaceae cyanobacterium]